MEYTSQLRRECVCEREAKRRHSLSVCLERLDRCQVSNKRPLFCSYSSSSSSHFGGKRGDCAYMGVLHSLLLLAAAKKAGSGANIHRGPI